MLVAFLARRFASLLFANTVLTPTHSSQTEEEKKKHASEVKALQRKLEKAEEEAKKNAEELEKVKKEGKDLANKFKDVKAMQKELEDLRELAAKTEELRKRVSEDEKAMEKLNVDYSEEKALRKKYWNMMEDMKGKIRVYARCRPFNKLEMEEGGKQVVKFVDDTR